MCGADRSERRAALAADERAELDWLRTENTLLRTERDALLRIATEFAQDAGFLRGAADDTSVANDIGAANDIGTAAARGGNHEDATMDTSRDQQVWLTRPAYERLRLELATLRGEHSTIPDSEASGETGPTPEYITDANRRHTRIQQILDMLNRAVVGESPPDDGVAEPGMVLTVRFDDEDDTETFLLGTRAGEVDDDIEVYSPDSPLGAALIGARQGDVRSYGVPSGATVRATLVRAVPYAAGGSEFG
ncbi:GreA/GreB family elongation factor [Bounagaea algeriensis]